MTRLRRPGGRPRSSVAVVALGVAAVVLVAAVAVGVRLADRRGAAQTVRTASNPVPLPSALVAGSRSRVIETTVTSAVLARPVPVRLYVPAHVRTDHRYPWLLLLHGNPGTDDDFFAHGFATALDEAIEDHRLPPLYAIAPDGNAGPGGDSEWLDGPNAAMETFVVNELIPILEHQLPLALGPASHAAVGVSMGGFGALNLTYRHPETFHTVVSMSGYTLADGSVFAGDSAPGRANSPQLLAAESGPRVATMLVDGGGGDLPGFADENRLLAGTLRAVHADVEWHEENAPHSWSYWTRLFPAVLAFLGHHLRK